MAHYVQGIYSSLSEKIHNIYETVNHFAENANKEELSTVLSLQRTATAVATVALTTLAVISLLHGNAFGVCFFGLSALVTRDVYVISGNLKETLNRDDTTIQRMKDLFKPSNSAALANEYLRDTILIKPIFGDLLAEILSFESRE